MHSFLEDILQLSNTRVVDYKLKNHKIYIEVESIDPAITCRKCGGKTKSKGYGEEREIRHLPILERECYLVIKPRRGICENCDDTPTTNQRLDWYDYKSRYSKPYLGYIALQCVNSTAEDVAKKEGLSADTVISIIEKQVDKKVDWSKYKKLKTIGVDEIAIKKGYKDYLTIVSHYSDSGTKVIAVIKGREKEPLEAFLQSIPAVLKRSIKNYCCDMNEGYVNAGLSSLQKAKIIIDRFHVSKLYRKTLVELRKRELERLREKLSLEKYQSLKPAIKILMRNGELVTKNQRQELEKLFKHSPKLRKCYSLCRQLTAIFNTKMTQKKATKKIDDWITKATNSKLVCMRKFIKTLTKYQEHIVNYFIERQTSGFVEGFNNKIKVLKRRCYGIFCKYTLFTRLILDTEGYSLFSKESRFVAC